MGKQRLFIVGILLLLSVTAFAGFEGKSYLEYAHSTFESCGTGYYCYQDYEEAELDAEDNAISNANHRCSSGEASRNSAWRTKNSSANCSVTRCADFKCKR